MKDYLIKLFAVIGIILIAALGSFSAYAEEVSVESACDMITASIPEKERSEERRVGKECRL